MREGKLRSGVNWQWTLQQKGVKQTGVKDGISEICNCVRLVQIT
jgi:hypothetical protein